MLTLLVVSLTLYLINMTGGVWANKLLPKTQNQFIVASFTLVGLDRLVPGKWLTSHMWYRYINKNHILVHMPTLLMLQCYIMLCHMI